MPITFSVVTSSYFRVKDVAQFRAWFQHDFVWAQESRIEEYNGLVSYRGWGEKTYLRPMTADEIRKQEERFYQDDDDYGDEDDLYSFDWLNSFADQLRSHLDGPQEVRFVSTHVYQGTTNATLWVIPPSGCSFFLDIDPSDQKILQTMQDKLNLYFVEQDKLNQVE